MQSKQDAGKLPARMELGRRRQSGWLHYFANPGRFVRFARPVLPWLAAVSALLTVTGMVWGYVFAPADFQQGNAARIMYVHVPAAWVSMSGYATLALCSFFSLVWRHPLADIAAEEIGPVGAGFTFVCLVSGALWGRPTWGTYWVWDARLTSVLILFFLYLGHIALVRGFESRERGYRAGAILALAGVVNLPIIVFSVQWWNTLHQGNSISLSGSSIYPSMLYPLLVSTLGFYLSFVSLVLARMLAAIMERKTSSLLLANAEHDA
ncbi:heme ABC transporter permease [Acidocella sp.]|uniref:heme ABC transporter permease n=1 Tax=Acidocella sp. TaxID=50710 RepID=UPI0038D10B2D